MKGLNLDRKHSLLAKSQDLARSINHKAILGQSSSTINNGKSSHTNLDIPEWIVWSFRVYLVCRSSSCFFFLLQVALTVVGTGSNDRVCGGRYVLATRVGSPVCALYSAQTSSASRPISEDKQEWLLYIIWTLRWGKCIQSPSTAPQSWGMSN